jgi:nucleoside-diphosphate kinase
MDSTYAMIKPEAVGSGLTGVLIDHFLRNRFELRRLLLFRFSQEEAEEFYAVHRERPFFRELVEYICSGPVVGMELAKENAVEDFRALIGSTDPAQAAPGTVRFMFGRSLQENAVHGSDARETARRELELVFGRG